VTIVTAKALPCAMNSRRFPPPWSVEETDACFIVRDATGQKIAYIYYVIGTAHKAAERPTYTPHCKWAGVSVQLKVNEH
jgi:hypothetical protein